MPVADAVMGSLLSEWHPRRVLPHLLVAICVGIVVYPFARGILDNLVVSSILVIIGLVVWFGSESEVKASLNSSVRSVLSSFDFDKLLALVFDVLEKERNFFTDIFGSDSMRPLLKFAAMLAVRSVGFYLVLFSIVISVDDLVLQTTGTDYLLSSSSIGAGLILFLLVVALIAMHLNSSQEYQETQDLASKNPLARDVLTLYFYGNFKKILAGVTNVMKDVASLLTFPLTGKNPFVFESMQDLYFPNGLLEMVDVEVKAGRLIVKNRNEYERLKEADIKGTGLTELLKLTQNEILKLSLSSKPDPSLANYRANRCQFLFPDSSGSVVLSAFKGCLSSVERVRAFRGIRQRRIAAFLVFAVGEKKPVSDLKLKLELNAKKITNELAACEGP